MLSVRFSCLLLGPGCAILQAALMTPSSSDLQVPRMEDLGLPTSPAPSPCPGPSQPGLHSPGAPILPPPA